MTTEKVEILRDAKVLSRLLPGEAKSPSVESSARTIERKGHENASANSEQKIGAHLLRLLAIREMDGDGGGREDILWNHAIDRLILPRDTGYAYKDSESIREDQQTSLENITSFLRDNKNNYPAWFQYYVWDGVTKLGKFDGDKRMYVKRSKGSVDSFPKLREDAVSDLYTKVSGLLADNASGDISGEVGFNALYSRCLVEVTGTIPVPEKAEDVHGEWVLYTRETVDKLVAASQLTPWCTSDKSSAMRDASNGGGVWVFHLKNPDDGVGVHSETGYVAMRMGYGGRIAEIAGLGSVREGKKQQVDDVLLPAVLSKVRELGDKNFTAALEDKLKIAEMDKKFQARQPFTIDELRFLYDLDGKGIQYVETYDKDVRPDTFKKHIDEHYKQLADVYGAATANWLLLDYREAKSGYELRDCLEKGADVAQIMKRMKGIDIVQNVDTLLSAGAEVDLGEIMKNLTPLDVISNIATLEKHGARVEIDGLVRELYSDDVGKYFNVLIGHGATLQNVVDHLDSVSSVRLFADIVKMGGKPNLDHVRSKISEVETSLLVEQLDVFAQWGIHVPIERIVRDTPGGLLIDNLDKVLCHGGDPNEVARKAANDEYWKFVDKLGVFLHYGVDQGVLKDLLSHKDGTKIKA